MEVVISDIFRVYESGRVDAHPQMHASFVHSEKMTLEQAADFPLFPLGMVALPSEEVPLHIFEERYKLMIGECIAEQKEFGIVLRHEDDSLHEVGCALTVDEVLDQMDDGRLNIMCRGTRPFRIIEKTEDRPYPSATVEFLTDNASDADGAGAETRSVYAELYTEATEREIPAEDLLDLSSYEMASTVDFGVEAKQTLLELRDEAARLSMLESLFRAALKRVSLEGKAEALAGSNGRVRFGSENWPTP
jgi:Lon protease-like protein